MTNANTRLKSTALISGSSIKSTALITGSSIKSTALIIGSSIKGVISYYKKKRSQSINCAACNGIRSAGKSVCFARKTTLSLLMLLNEKKHFIKVISYQNHDVSRTIFNESKMLNIYYDLVLYLFADGLKSTR